MKIGLGIGIPKQQSSLGGVPFPDNISDPIERAIVQALSISEAEYNANGMSNSVRAWWEADSGVTGSPSVTAWNDKSGNGNHLTTATGSPQLNLSNSNINNQPSVDFNGDDAMQALSSLMNIEQGDCTIIGIYDTSSEYVATEQDVASPYSSNIIIGGQVNNASLWINADDVRPGTNDLGLFTITNDADGNAVIYQDGALSGTLTSPTRNTTLGVFTLGGAVDLDAGFYVGPIPIFLIIDGLLNDSQRGTIETAIATKYAITLA